MKKPVLLSLSAWMILGGVQLAHAQKANPQKNAASPNRTENKTGVSVATPPANTGGLALIDNQISAQDPRAELVGRSVGIRRMMNVAGLTDKRTQDAVIGFIFEQEKQRQPLLQLAREAVAEMNRTAETQEGGLTAVATDPNAVPGDANKEVIDDDPGLSKYQEYEQALEGDVARYNADLQKLDTQIEYSRKPRLEAFLRLFGVLDTDTYGFGGPAAIFMPSVDALLAEEPSLEQRASKQPRTGTQPSGAQK